MNKSVLSLLVNNTHHNEPFLEQNDVVIGLNVIQYSFDYDNRFKYANIILNCGDLTLVIIEKYIKTGIGKGIFFDIVEKINIGTLQKPNKKLLNSTLSKHKYYKTTFKKDKWYTPNSDQYVNSKDVFENKILLRKLKLKSIIEKIKINDN